MNAKQVLGKIAAMLSLDTKEVEFTDAKTADGTILQSPTFDLGEKVEVVSEDGTKTPAPDGEHEIALKDSEGNEVLIKIETKDGVITERENVELPEAEAETEEEALEQEPKVTDAENVTEGLELAKADAETKTAHALPNTTDEDPRNRVGTDTDDKKDPIIALSYRITELEKSLMECKAALGDLTDRKDIKGDAEVKKEADIKLEEEEINVPKLDGAPVEEFSKVNLSGVHKPSRKEGDYQGSFLSKLYK